MENKNWIGLKSIKSQLNLANSLSDDHWSILEKIGGGERKFWKEREKMEIGRMAVDLVHPSPSLFMATKNSVRGPTDWLQGPPRKCSSLPPGAKNGHCGVLRFEGKDGWPKIDGVSAGILKMAKFSQKINIKIRKKGKICVKPKVN